MSIVDNLRVCMNILLHAEGAKTIERARAQESQTSMTHAPSTQNPTSASDVQPLSFVVRQRLRTRLVEQALRDDPHLDGILLLSHANVVWASGFDHSPSERPVGLYVPAEGQPTLFVPTLEIEHAEGVEGVEVLSYFEFPGTEHPVLWMHRQIMQRQERPTRIAVDQLDVSVMHQLHTQGADLVLSQAPSLVRGVKEPEELALIRAAAHYADACLTWILHHGGELIRSGANELTVLKGGVDHARAALDADLGHLFAVSQLHVVGTLHSGPRAALPHGRTSTRLPQAGEPVIAGIGAKVGGYHAESGATFAVSHLTKETEHCLAAADACRLAAIQATRVGATCVSVHEAAMAELEAAGLSEHIRHRIGHGMGVEGHEAPWLAPGDTTRLEANMVFSNEPGIYRPEVDGYRTIDSMIVTDSDAEIPSRFQSTVPWHERILRTN